MRKFYKVRPRVTLVKDENDNTVRSDYHYGPCPNSTVSVLCWNRDQAPPSGDFLQEQLWAVDAPEESHALFASDPGVTEVTPEECCTIGEQWDGPKEIDDPLPILGSKIVCPDCGSELVCPDCGPMNGKTPAARRRHNGFDPQDHAHHLGQAVVDAHKAKKVNLIP